MTREQRIALAVIAWLDRRRGLGGLKGGTDVGEFGRPAGVGQEAKVADAAEATGQDMQQEPADELAGVKRHRFALVAGAGGLPAGGGAPPLARGETAGGGGGPGRGAGEGIEKPPGAAPRAPWLKEPLPAPPRGG